MKDAPALPDFDLMRFTPYRLAVAAQVLSEGLARQYRDRFGISIPEWRVIVHVAHAGGASVRDIEAKVAMEKSKVSRAAARLEAKGLITKRVNDDDRRLVRLTLTARGQRLMGDLLPVAQAFQDEIAARLGPSLDALETGLDALLGGPDDTPA